jgi:hypothetical protein
MISKPEFAAGAEIFVRFGKNKGQKGTFLRFANERKISAYILIGNGVEKLVRCTSIEILDDDEDWVTNYAVNIVLTDKENSTVGTHSITKYSKDELSDIIFNICKLEKQLLLLKTRLMISGK